MAAIDDEIKDLGRTIASMTGKGRGFAFLIGLGGEFFYASNGTRADVRQSLMEWLTRLTVNTCDAAETPVAVRARLAIEERCAEIGRVVSLAGSPIILFVFDFGDGGNMAYFTNVPEAPKVVERFLKESA